MVFGSGHTHHSPLEHAVTALFVPGDRPERFEKTAQSGAGFIILDLEDAVAEDRRGIALDAVVRAIASGLTAAVRVVAADNPAHSQQLACLRATPPAGIMLPKCQAAEDIVEVRDAVGADVPIIALIETARGVFNASAIAAAPGVARLAFGAFDYTLDVDGDAPWLLGHARANIVIASRVAGIAAALDSPTAEFQDLRVVESAASAARNGGFSGQLCIHPAQVPVVERAFSPTAAQIANARDIIKVADGVAEVNGQMVDRPVIEKARRILQQVQSREAL